jgi:hypothetical protein
MFAIGTKPAIIRPPGRRSTSVSRMVQRTCLSHPAWPARLTVCTRAGDLLSAGRARFASTPGGFRRLPGHLDTSKNQ